MRMADTQPQRAAAFGEFRFRVTQCESEASASLATLFRAWRDLIDIGGSDPDFVSMGQRIKEHLRNRWNLRIASPPAAEYIDRASRSSATRYDLLPRNVREL